MNYCVLNYRKQAIDEIQLDFTVKIAGSEFKAAVSKW